MSATTSHTTKLYLKDTYLFEADATVLAVGDVGDGRVRLALDRTIFYPKGGGQPADRGLICWSSGEAEVVDVVAESDLVIHITMSRGSQVRAGEAVRLSIDRERRLLHARIHTAGELLCDTMWTLGYSYPRHWPVVGAIHYPDRSSVEFGALLAEGERERLPDLLGRELNRRIRAGGPVEVQLVEGRAAAAALCGFVPDYLPEEGVVRVVRIGTRGRPCGGTHVADLTEIGAVQIRKIRCRKGCTTISYEILPG